MATFTQTMSGDGRYSVSLTVTEVLPSDYLTTNKSNVNYVLTATKSSGGGYWDNDVENPVVVTINGTNVVDKNIRYDFSTSTPCTITLAEGTVEGILHNDDGTKTINVSGSFTDRGNSLGSATASGQLQLTTIPRKTSITSFTVAKRTETSLTFGWSTSDTVDYVWYSTNNGSSWADYGVTDGTSGSFAVSGLTENTTYNCKIRVRRKDSQLTTDSNTVSQTTNAYPSFATQPTYISRTETILDVNYKPNMTVALAQYRIKTSSGSYGNWVDINSNNIISGSATSTAGCTFRISSLTANTNYVVQVRLKSTLSDNYTNSSEVSTNMYTYAYPYCTESPNFTISNDGVTLKLYNPLSRAININIIGNGTQLAYTWSTSGTSLKILDGSTTQSQLYATIPNKTSATYQVKVTYDGHTNTRSNNNTYTINVNDCKPTFSDFTYSTNYSELTGNNATIINGKTTTTFTIPVVNKATPKNSATITKYRFECGTQTKDVTYSSSESVSDTIANCTNQIIKVSAIDSRGLETTVSKTVTNFIGYSKPSFRDITTDRNDGVETTTKLDFRINYWNGNFGSVSNTITSVQYRSKLTTASDYGSYTSIPVSSLVLSNGVARLTDYLIHANGSSGGFEVGKEYNVEVKITDGNGSTTLETITALSNVTDGNVAFSTFKDSNGKYHIGFNGMPNANYTNIINGNERVTDGLYSDDYIYTNRLQVNGFFEGHEISGSIGGDYWYICDITSTGTYQDQPIEFYIIQRNRYGKIFIRPTGSGTTGVLNIDWSSIESHSDMRAYYYYADNKIQLYLLKQQTYDNAEIYIKKGHYMRNTDITWKGTMVSSLPSGYAEIPIATKKLNILGNADTATKATQDSDGVQINTNYAKAGTAENTTFDSVTSTLKRSGLYSAYIESTWYNIINVRHRNGESDGTSYGLQIRGKMTTSDAGLQYRNQASGSWSAWHTIARDADWVEGTTKKTLSSKSHSGWTNQATDDMKIPSMSFIANWNGAYNSSNASSLTYAYQGVIQCKPTNLYNNTSGTTGTVTLSQSVANFTYLVIYYGKDACNSSTEIYSPNGKNNVLLFSGSAYSTKNIQSLWANINISGTSITRGNTSYLNFYSNNAVEINTENWCKIYRVDGWK